MKDFERLSREADAAGFRLEVVQGLATVEASPVWRHQKNVDRNRASIRPTVLEDGYGCVHGADIQIRFPDDSQGEKTYTSPALLTFLCDCTVTV